MIEHRPWIGRIYDTGIDRKRILIVGYSHWGSVDHAGPTEEVVSDWSRGSENAPFATRIRQYFEHEDPATFWQSVAFANSLPNCVGEEADRYADGTPEQIAAIAPRALRMIHALKPDLIFVFSRKAWKKWPDYDGAFPDRTLYVEGVGQFDAGTYRHASGETIAFGFGHPQYASVGLTRIAVQTAMRVKAEDLMSNA